MDFYTQAKKVVPLTSCNGHWKNESAFFLFPWEYINAFHAMNDNLFVVLTSIYLQSALYPQYRTIPKSLYGFRLPPIKDILPTNMFNLLDEFFHRRHFPAARLFRDGPHCIQNVNWGSALKPFYRDSFYHLRMKLSEFFKMILRHQYRLPDASLKMKRPQLLTTREIGSGAKQENTTIPKFSRGPKVMIMTRQPFRNVDRVTSQEKTSNSPDRKIAQQSEAKLMQLYRSYGATVEICCDFSLSAQAITEKIWDTDICIGIHGAGLTNCIFGREGIVIIELQTDYNFGLDTFLKIAHMMKGHYMLYDIRQAPLHRGVGAGSKLSDKVIEDIVYLSYGVWQYSMDYTLPKITTNIQKIDAQEIPAIAFIPPSRTNSDNEKRNESVVFMKDGGQQETIPLIQQFHENPQLVYQLLYRQEVLIDMEHDRFHVDSESISLNGAPLISQLQRIIPRKLSPSKRDKLVKKFNFTIHPLTDHPAYSSIEKLVNISRMVGNLKRSEYTKRIREIAKQHNIVPYKQNSHREYFLFLNPSIRSQPTSFQVMNVLFK
jgi:hypothetical protein